MRPVIVPALLVLGASLILALHARVFDFVCDDAFITLRYARNLAQHGSPVYNLGERVEGYTSPLWMGLCALGMSFGADGVGFLRGLGLASGVALILAAARLSFVVFGRAHGRLALVLFALATSAPVAAWTSGGLETALFTALLTLFIAEAHLLTERPTRAIALRAGALLALSVLTRHEAVLFAAPLTMLLRAPATRRHVLVALSVAAVPIALFVGWRFAYYGALLPNTFGVKAAGASPERALRGLRYLWLFIADHGFVLPVLALLSPFWPARSGVFRIARGAVPLYLAFVVWVGGDFLDLYRFIVPIMPLLLVTSLAVVHELLERRAVRPSPRIALAAIVLVVHVMGNAALGARALRFEAPERAASGIEPLGWTKHQTMAWAEMGKWIARQARPGDSMAIGASGAMPYYARLPNLDLYGLCSRDVAQHGFTRGTRPGHQRQATLHQILAWRPTFLVAFHGPAAKPATDTSYWAKEGYAWIRAPIASDMTFLLLVRRERAEEIVARGLATVEAQP